MRASRHDPDRLLRALSAQRRRLGEEPAAAPTGAATAASGASQTQRLADACVDAVTRGLDRGIEPDPGALRAAVRVLLDRLAGVAPGASVEVRVPPYGVVQCVAGPRHTRGTPPNVVETDPLTWVALATGRQSWSEAAGRGAVRASGPRSDLSPWLPVRGSSRSLH